jgi:hypothetical protein
LFVSPSLCYVVWHLVELPLFLQGKQRETLPVEAKVTGEVEARIITLACGEVPKG